METILAIVTLLSGVVGLIAWWVKRKRAPTLDERVDDLKKEYADSIENVHRLRTDGKQDEAESMLRRMRERAAIGRVREQSSTTVIRPDAQR